jgi:ribose transport system permease protein
MPPPNDVPALPQDDNQTTTNPTTRTSTQATAGDTIMKNSTLTAPTGRGATAEVVTGPGVRSVSGFDLGGLAGRAARQGGLLVVIVVMVIGFGIARPFFLDSSNLMNVLLQSAVVGILALGQTYVLITGGIDLSIGSTVAVTAVCAGLFSHSMPAIAAIIGALVIGAICGLVNGLLITVTNITPFIITLGTMSIYAGLALIIAGGQAVYGIPVGFENALAGGIAGIPIPVVLFVVLTVVSALVLKFTLFGEYLVAIGGNSEVARLAGIRVGQHTATAYVVAGAGAGLAGAILTARLGAADPTLGGDLLLTAIAATVMGGTKLAGGDGSMIGAAFGAVLIATLTAGLTSLNVQAFYQQVAVGGVIILALLVDQAARSRKS